jgi:hypothetical protein
MEGEAIAAVAVASATAVPAAAAAAPVVLRNSRRSIEVPTQDVSRYQTASIPE